MRDLLRRLLGRGETTAAEDVTTLFDVGRAVAFGSEEEAARKAAAWARQRRDEEERREEREAYDERTRRMRERVMRGPGWFPGDDL